MNILILSWRGPGHPNAGGAELSTHEHAKGWVKENHNVTLFTSSFKGGRNKEILDGVKIIRRGSDVFIVHLLAFFWYLFGKHEKFDVVVDEFHGIPFFTPLYVRTEKLAFIHEVAKEVWWLNPWPRPFNLIPAIVGTIFERFVFLVLYRNTPFMTVSESTKKDLVNWDIPAKNITVIHNGVNVLKVKVKKEKKKTAVFLGALAKDKGIEDAVEVFALINQRDPGWQFWVIGRGLPDYVKELEVRSEKLGIGKKIKFWGYISENKKFELLGKVHILVNPSIREGWGLVNIEANSVGIPVVGYNVPGVRDSVLDGKTGLLVGLGDIRGLAENGLKLIENANQYEKFRRNAVEFSKKFSWEESTRMSLELIEKICKK